MLARRLGGDAGDALLRARAAGRTTTYAGPAHASTSRTCTSGRCRSSWTATGSRSPCLPWSRRDQRALGAAARDAAADPGDRPVVRAGERCEMCAQPIADEHQHVVDLESRTLMCTCRGCYLLFTDQHADAALPRRARPLPLLPRLRLRCRGLGRAPDPGRASPSCSATRCRNGSSPSTRARPAPPSPSSRWRPGTRVVAANPALGILLPDVEALLIYRADRGRGEFSCLLVPIDVCYELVGTMRTTWRGFDGGEEARAAMEEFFARAEAGRGRRPRSRTAKPHDRPAVRGPRRRRRAVRRRAAADRVRLRHQEWTESRDPRDRAALPGPDRAAAPPLRRGRAERPACAVRRTGSAGRTPCGRSCGCTATRRSRVSPGPPRSTCRCRAPTTST